MRPVVVAMLSRWLGPLAGWLVPTYPVMLGLASLLSAILFVENSRRLGHERRQAVSVAMVGYALGLAGAHAVPLVQGLVALASQGVFRPGSGMAAYGGFFGGVLGAVWWLRRAKLPVLPFLDAAAPAMGLGYFFARLGCFLAGCDYGKPTTLALGVRFPRGSHAFRDHVARGLIEPDAAASLPVHPTQLYLSFVGLGLYLLCARLPARGDGSRFLVYVGGYAALRSLIELLRGDEGRGFLGPLSTSQALALISVLVAVFGVRAARRAELSVPG